MVVRSKDKNTVSKRKLILGYGSSANRITLLGLIFSFFSCYFALHHDIRLAMTFLMAAGACDLMDGFVARKSKQTDVEKKFGIQLDTIIDMVSFGVVPVVIVYSLVGAPWYALCIYIFYMLCAAIRLAHFNTITELDTPRKYFQGLPVTSIVLILPLVLLFNIEIVSVTALAATGLLFISRLAIPKLRGAWYAIFFILTIVLLILWWLVVV